MNHLSLKVNATITNKTLTEPKAKGNEVSSATKPNKAGPASCPVYPSVVTPAIAALGDISGRFPAVLKNTGTILAQPMPTNTKPIIVATPQGIIIADSRPIAAIAEP